MACVRAAARDLVPYSSEGAETLATAILARCSDHERKRVTVAINLGISGDSAEAIMARHVAEVRRQVIHQIAGRTRQS